MKDGILTRAMAAIEAAGLPLAGTLHPAREAEYLAVPGVGRKALQRLREHAAAAAPKHGGARPGAGRPAGIESARRVNVMLDAATIERARAIGAGNLSAGIRLAVREAGLAEWGASA